MLIAAGLPRRPPPILVQAGLLPPLGYDIWNTSAILPQTNPVGFLLHILVGYVARPEGIQIARLCRHAGDHPGCVEHLSGAVIRPARSARAEPKTLHQPAGRKIGIARGEDGAVRLVVGIARRRWRRAATAPAGRSPRRDPASRPAMAPACERCWRGTDSACRRARRCRCACRPVSTKHGAISASTASSSAEASPRM